ncbi:MAG TPA: branched-chain amino acid ABC transporter permease [Hyphomicrobiaceae bacterium]|nr:branched-chain amino acid ABC transporter permease [Hyphomicrobiaceae bacterium]
MELSWDLTINAVLSGLLLGGFYAAVTLGVTIAFGMLDIVNIAHPAMIVLGAFTAYWLNSSYGIDPLLAAAITVPVAYLAGRALYRGYYYAFERRGEESLQGLAFFFGILFIVEVGLLLEFGVDYRTVEASYIGPSIDLPLGLSAPMRFVIPLVVGLAMVLAVHVFLSRTFIGRAILAVSQDPGALQFVGGSPVKAKEIAFGIAIATAIVAGALLIIIQPVEPGAGRDFLGRVFAICVLGGMTSLAGTVVAAMILGVAEAFTTTYWGPSWAPAIAFSILLVTLAVRPSGIFGR